MNTKALAISMLLFTSLLYACVSFQSRKTPKFEKSLQLPKTNLIQEEWKKVEQLKQIDQTEQLIKASTFYSQFPKDEDQHFNSVVYHHSSHGRSLNTYNEINNSAIISFDHQDNQNQERNAYQYILTNLAITSTKFIIYPFSFDYVDKDSNVDHYKKGAIFSIKPDELPIENSLNYFKFLATSTTTKFGKSKALYDINIGILKVEGFFDNVFQVITYEGGLYCNFLTSYLGKYRECMTSANYNLFKRDIANNGKTALVYATPQDIADGLLITNGRPIFELLIIPDYSLGSHNIITNLFGENGVNNLKSYLQCGGKIFVSGKGGYLLQLMGILPEIYSGIDRTLFSLQKDNIAKFIGCGGVENSDPSDAAVSFTKQMICMNITEEDNVTASTFALSTYMMDPSKASEITIYTTFDPSDTNLRTKDTATGKQSFLTNTEKQYLPLAFSKAVGNGIIYGVNANPLYYASYAKLFYNYLFIAMSKSLVLEYLLGTTNNLPIPGGEAGIQMALNVSFLNLYTTPINHFTTHIWFPPHVEPKEFPDNCVIDTSNDSDTLTNLTGVDLSSHLKCTNEEVAGFERMLYPLKIEIADQSVTAPKYNFLIAYPVVEFTESGVKSLYDSLGLTANAALAAILRGSLNPDPVSHYPLNGGGHRVAQNLQVENKEDTDALNSTYYAIVPLISPVLNGQSQTQVVRTVKFVKKYYSDRGYKVPFTNTEGENYDFIDYKYLSNKGVLLVSEWDNPVKVGKVERTDADFGELNGDITLDVGNGNAAAMVDSVNIVLKQIYYNEADKFFEHAGQRTMVFADISTEEGAKLYYEGNAIPLDEQNPDNPNVAKKEFVFARHDIFFYESAMYINPKNLNFNHFISIDKFAQNTQDCNNAGPVLKVTGHFNDLEGLLPNQYDNELFRECGKTKVDPEDIATITENTASLTHYVVPVVDPTITRASHIVGFVENPDKTGYMEDYPRLQFTFGHTLQVNVNAIFTRQGGKISIKLPSDVIFTEDNPVEKSYITYSADQVAFYKSDYDTENNIINAYFKRGLMPNEAYGKTSTMQIMLEHLNTTTAFDANIEVYEMKYDISSQDTDYEVYFLQYNNTVEFKSDRFFILPSISFKIGINRNGVESVLPYELLEPFSRFGVYIQELKHHTTLWSYRESHHISDPGLQSIISDFSLISNLGISSVPMAEYVTHGGLFNPSCPTTSRLEWTDLWGRKWAQPLRSVFPDVHPVPPPVRNIMMTSTFGIYKFNSTEVVTNWQSDETVDLLVQLKFISNFPKYFEITKCKENEIAYFNAQPGYNDRTRISLIANPSYPYYDFQINSTDAPDDTYHISFGAMGTYGKCFDEEGTVLEGLNVTAEQRATISTAYLCAATLDPNQLLQCIANLADIPTITARPNNDSTLWNYSPEVEKYYPENYIKSNMWDLTHYDYDNNAMDKAYKYHTDNNIPSFDFMVGTPANPAVSTTQNVIVQPIFKGFGYKISYSNTKKLAQFPDYSGWWSDNLQNRDNTLVAGQSKVNDVSVGQPTLLPDSAWINGKDLKNPMGTTAVNRMKYYLVCKYNQHRVRLSPSQQRFAYLANVLQNNVIPVIPETEVNFSYTDFNCNNEYQYTPYNISLENNIVETPTIRDWLYFAANIRAGARENINIPFTLGPISSTKFEGMVKVNDGGRFIYWNPTSGVSSYLTVDNPVFIVEAVRSDLSIECEVFPQDITTFNAEIYHLFTVYDKDEIDRQWKYITYTNNYGFGDSVVSIYVGGGSGASGSVLLPGQSTTVKFTFYNDAGFNWNMKVGAITFDTTEIGALDETKLLKDYVLAVQVPTEYNFFTPLIPDEIKDYIELVPSSEYSDVSPQAFDFDNINVVTIKDGFKGDYYYKLTVKPNFPSSLMGKVYEIQVQINQNYFDALPGYNDPTNTYHNYTLKVPQIKFGVPYPDGHALAGKVYYTSGYSTHISISSYVPSGWEIVSAKPVDSTIIDSIRDASGDPKLIKSKLSDIWDGIGNAELEVTSVNGGYDNIITVNLETYAPTFPIKDAQNPDIAKAYILLKLKASQMNSGTVRVISSPTIHYTTATPKNKDAVIPAPVDKTVGVKGAWLQVIYTGTIVNQTEDGLFVDAEDQNVFPGDTALYRSSMYIKNSGTDIAYGVNLTVQYNKNVPLITKLLDDDALVYEIDNTNAEYNTIFINLNQQIAVGEFVMIQVCFNYTIPEPQRRKLAAFPASFTFINQVSAKMSLTAIADDTSLVTQSIATPLTIGVIQRERDIVGLEGINIGNVTNPKIQLKATPNFLNSLRNLPIRYNFLRRIVKTSCGNESCSGVTDNTQYSEVCSLSNVNSCIDDLKLNNVANLSNIVLQYKVVTLDEYTKTLASSEWALNDKELEALISKDPWQFPMYAIIVIIVGALCCTAIVVFFLLRRKSPPNKKQNISSF